MGQQHRQSKQVDVSGMEILLLAINIVIIISGIIYFISNWNQIPDGILITRSKHGREWLENQPKLSYFLSIFLYSFPLLVLTISAIKNSRVVDDIFLKRRKVSCDLSKAKKQFLVERRCYLCGFAICQTSFFVGSALYIERQLRNPFVPSEISISNFFLVIIVINWLLHHIAWNKFADK
jgi:hypothetical protein